MCLIYMLLSALCMHGCMGMSLLSVPHYFAPRPEPYAGQNSLLFDTQCFVLDSLFFRFSSLCSSFLLFFNDRVDGLPFQHSSTHFVWQATSGDSRRCLPVCCPHTACPEPSQWVPPVSGRVLWTMTGSDGDTGLHIYIYIYVECCAVFFIYITTYIITLSRPRENETIIFWDRLNVASRYKRHLKWMGIMFGAQQKSDYGPLN